jgi:hypothetical protein
MLGDESIGDIALGEADITSPTTSAMSAIAEFSWSVSADAEFVWSEGESTSSFGWV